jgi:hypothetical protein
LKTKRNPIKVLLATLLLSATSGAPIIIEGKWHLKCKKLEQDDQDPFLGPLDPPNLTP